MQPPQTDASATSATSKDEDNMDEAPPTSGKHSDKDKAATEELLRQKEQLERERVCYLLHCYMSKVIDYSLDTRKTSCSGENG